MSVLCLLVVCCDGGFPVECRRVAVFLMVVAMSCRVLRAGWLVVECDDDGGKMHVNVWW